MDNKTDEILGCDPSFSGEGELKLGLESFATDPPTYAGLEGGLSGWQTPPTNHRTPASVP